jgi:peptide/nickel transport system ATP-binding protein
VTVVATQPPSADEKEEQPGGLTVSGLRVATKDGRTIVRAIDLAVARGETIGIVGESGSGKSMTARALIGLPPAGILISGEVRWGKRNLIGLRERELRRIRGREVGLVMQDPFTTLNPLLRCGKQITEGLCDESSGRRLRGHRRQAEAVRRLAEVGIKDPAVAEKFPFQLSGGMRQRVGIAAALSRDPEMLIADEPSTALDVTTQKEILTLLKSLQESRGMGLILITHDLRVAMSTCERIYVMYAGSVLEVAPAEHLDAEPRHPYTLGLLCSDPPADRRLAKLPAIDGSVPRPDDVAKECPFAARCQWVQPQCLQGAPALQSVDDGERLSACVRIQEIRTEMQAVRGRVLQEHVPVQATDVIADPLVRIEDLRKVFKHSGGETCALDGVSLEIGNCESVGLVGESGSGKTTLGRCLMGLEHPSSGAIHVDGIDAHSWRALSAQDRAKLRRTVQMVFQDPYSSLNPVRSIGSTLQEAILARDSRARKVADEVKEILQRVGLPAEYTPRKPSALSGGERQRVAIARALAMRPRLIVCDEPVSALDVSVQAQILNLFGALREDYEISYLFITHDLAVVRQVAERLYVLLNGKVVESGASDVILDRPQHEYTRKLVASIPGVEIVPGPVAPAELSAGPAPDTSLKSA